MWFKKTLNLPKVYSGSMNQKKYFNSKLLLFGEYTIINGGEALAMPLKKYRGYWKKGTDKTLQQDLSKFAEYLKEKNFTCLSANDFKNDLAAGWYFQSNIPTGYGAGSSGALVAAVLKKYSDENELKEMSISDLKTLVADMESFFHGASSGMDPLVCYLNSPLHFKSKTEILKVKKTPKLKSQKLFLLDTRHPRKTAPFVNHYLDQLNDSAFAKMIEQQLKALNQKAIHSLLAENEETLSTSFAEISDLQFQYFQKMIPDYLQSHWKHGLQTDDFKLKICGAGGGGFMIGLTRDFAKAREVIGDFELFPI